MRLFITFFFIFFFACKPKNSIENSLKNNEFKMDFNIEEKIKEDINTYCINNYSKAHIYSIILIRLSHSTLMNVRPIYDNEYLKESSYPITFYEYQGILFLLYSGLESLITKDSEIVNLVQKKYDSVCKKYKITELHITHSDPPLFLKLGKDSIEKVDEQEFVMKEFGDVFFERELAPAIYSPKK